MKPSLDVNSIKEFCTDHVEKFVFGGVVLLLLIFAVRAVGTIRNLRPDYEPEELEKLAEEARNNWEKTDPGTVVVDFPIVPYNDRAKKILDPVPIDPYTPNGPWTPLINPPLAKREAPTLAAIEDLRAAAGNGAVQSMSQAMRGAGDQMVTMGTARNTQGRRWVVVTGLVPIKSHMEAYESVFRDAAYRNPMSDIPMYLGYRIERAEVLSGDDSELKWESIKLADAIRTAGYRSGSRQVIDRRYFPMAAPGALYPMVFPLPPLVNAVWGPEVAHYPEIKLLVDMPRSERGSMYGMQPGSGEEADETGEAGEGDTEGTETAPEPETDEFDAFAGPGGARGAMGGLPGGGPGMYGSGEDMYGGAGGSGMMPGGDMGSYEGAGGASMYGAMPGGYGDMGRRGTGMRGPKPVEYQLFRFFDFQVEPGRRYRYRVQAVLLNPNYRLDKRYLLEEKLGEDRFINADKSEPSDEVIVPYDSRLLAGPVKAPATILYEPSAQVVTLTLRMEDGFQAANDFTVYRGHLADFEAEIEEKKTRSAYGMPGYGSSEEDADGGSGMMDMGMMPGGGMGEPSPRRRNKKDEDEEPETIMHATRMLVLDMIGGEKLHRSDSDLTAPGNLLLMGPDGSLVIRGELEDQDEYLEHHFVEEKKPRRRERQPMDGYGSGMEGSPDGSMMEDMYGLGSGESDRRSKRGRGRRRGEGS